MDASEKEFARNLQDHGWWTKSKELSEVVTGQQTHEVDIVAYNPQTHKMFYGNLTHLSHETDESVLVI